MQEQCLIVDGYNVIFAWEELAQIAKSDLEAARRGLCDALVSYAGYKKCRLILVFDGYKVKGNPGEKTLQNTVQVVYTKENETADMYIEKASYDLSRAHRVKVATSDALEQMIIMGHGSERLSANDLKWEVDQAEEQIRNFLKKQK